MIKEIEDALVKAIGKTIQEVVSRPQYESGAGWYTLIIRFTDGTELALSPTREWIRE